MVVQEVVIRPAITLAIQDAIEHVWALATPHARVHVKGQVKVGKRGMNNVMKKEELKSRREFFKQAVKAALPVVGAAISERIPKASF